MSNELAPLAKVQDQIKDRIKAEFTTLIPDEMWGDLVQGVVNDFTKKRKPAYSHNPMRPSIIEELILEEITAQATEKIRTELAQHTATWDGYGQRVISDATQQMIKDHMPEMITAMHEGSAKMMVDLAMQNLKNSMEQY